MDAPQPPTDFRSVLASVDRDGRRRWIYAAIIPGVWRRRRTLFSALLIIFYLALPFLSINGDPVLRFDLVHKHYIVLGQTFWPQDFFYLLLALLCFIFFTLLLVSTFGRVFCGWICPHNVFLEGIFRRIETWCEGPAHKRRIADARTPWPPTLIGRKLLKWVLYLIAVGAMANTATALFIGSEDFIGGFLVDPVKHPTAAIFFAVFFALNLFNFAWFREQTCTIVCPYGRWQAALLDADTVGVTYDHIRGEPRGKKGSNSGDCIDCFQCVQVCPTGIDIRNGNQLECIHCTACIDACDDVMTRLKRPTGLIRYTSENALAGKPLRIIRPRGAIYAAALLTIISIGGIMFAGRTDVLAVRLRDSGSATVEARADGTELVRRQIHLALLNRARTTRVVELSLPPELEAEVFPPDLRLKLDSNQRKEQTVILRIPRSHFGPADGYRRAHIESTLTVRDDRGETTVLPLSLEAP